MEMRTARSSRPASTGSTTARASQPSSSQGSRSRTTLTSSAGLVNLSPLHARRVVVPAGACAEHQIGAVEVAAVHVPVGASHVADDLEPGCGGRLVLQTSRYANAPTFAFPWT